VGILKEPEAGLPTAELCRKQGISEQTFYRWKAKYGGLEVSDAQRLRQLEEENRKLKQGWPSRCWRSLASRRCYQKSGKPTGEARSRRGVSRRCGVLRTLHFITPGRPMENGYIESFHGKFVSVRFLPSGPFAGVGRRWLCERDD